METVFLPLPPTLRSKLLQAGFRTVDDFYSLSPVELAKEANISHQDAYQILNLVPGKENNGRARAFEGAKSAWEILSLEKSRKKVTTMSSELDRILGGGVCPGEVTEICGVPGIGKTQLGMQLAMTVQIPTQLGGTGGHAIYIDTEGSFMVERAVEMAEGTIADIQHAEASTSYTASLSSTPLSEWTPEKILSQIFYFRVHDYVEQIALVNSLPDFLERHPLVRLIVIDSVTFHFRQDFSDMAMRTRVLTGMSQKLMDVAASRTCAVVLVNQVTTKVSGETSHLVPALGETWSHACTNRVILFWAEGSRSAYVYKSPSLKNQTAQFAVCSSGIRDVAESGKRRKL